MGKHQIFQLLRKRSNDLKRSISCFRHLDIPLEELRISLFVYHSSTNSPELWACLALKSERLSLEENFNFYFRTKRWNMFAFGHARSLFPIGTHTFRLWYPDENSYYKEEDITSNQRISMEIFKLTEWLGSQRLVRVDPYNFNKILDSEETPEDTELEGVLAGVSQFERDLEKCELKPGIITPGTNLEKMN